MYWTAVRPSWEASFADSCLAIAASGSTVWELLCCGVPTILLSVAENQDRVRTHLVDAEDCWRAEVDSLAATIDTVVGDPESRLERAALGAVLVDGLGGDRVVAQLRSMDVEMCRGNDGGCRSIAGVGK